jgi:hypothetical protein
MSRSVLVSGSRFSLALASLLASHAAFGAPPAPAAAPAAVPAPTPEAPPSPTLADSLSGAAKADYDAARLLYDDHDYQGARLKLQSAYDASKDPRLLWNMAACEKNQRHYAAVASLVDRYLAEGGARVSETERAEAAELLTTVKGFIAPLTIEVSQPDAAVLLDGQVIGKSPLAGPIQVDMGAHALRITKPGYLALATTLQIEGGKPARMNAVLVVEKHEGKLRIIADPADVIQVDQKLTKVGIWDGALPSGAHSVYVSAKGKRPYKTDVVVQDNDTTNLHVALEVDSKPALEKSGVPAWLWVAGGALVVGGGVGAYLLLKPSSTPTYQSPTPGTWGTIPI